MDRKVAGDGVLMNVQEFFGDISGASANGIEIARLPERAGMVAIVLDGVTPFEFPLMHDVGQRVRAGHEEQMTMVRHHDVAEQKETDGTANSAENSK